MSQVASLHQAFHHVTPSQAISTATLQLARCRVPTPSAAATVRPPSPPPENYIPYDSPPTFPPGMPPVQPTPALSPLQLPRRLMTPPTHLRPPPPPQTSLPSPSGPCPPPLESSFFLPPSFPALPHHAPPPQTAPSRLVCLQSSLLGECHGCSVLISNGVVVKGVVSQPLLIQ